MDIHGALGADGDGDDGGDLFPSTSGKDAAGGGGGGSRKMRKASAKAEEMIKKELGQAPSKKSKAKVGKGKGDEDEDDDGEEEGDAVPSGPRVLGVSKKDPVLRRKELLSAGGTSSLATALTALVAGRAGPLLRSAHGASVVVEVSRGGDGGEPWAGMEVTVYESSLPLISRAFS